MNSPNLNWLKLIIITVLGVVIAYILTGCTTVETPFRKVVAVNDLTLEVVSDPTEFRYYRIDAGKTAQSRGQYRDRHIKVLGYQTSKGIRLYNSTTHEIEHYLNHKDPAFANPDE